MADKIGEEVGEEIGSDMIAVGDEGGVTAEPTTTIEDEIVSLHRQNKILHPRPLVLFLLLLSLLREPQVNIWTAARSPR